MGTLYSFMASMMPADGTADLKDSPWFVSCWLPVFCDRVVKPEEETFLTTLCSELSLPPGRASHIQEVFALLQRDVLAGEADA